MMTLNQNMNNSRFEIAEQKLKSMIRSKFGDPASEIYRIVRNAKNTEKAKQRIANIMELWRFDESTFDKLCKIWEEVVGEKYKQLEFDDEI